MKYDKSRVYVPLLIAFLLLFSGCAATVVKSPSPTEPVMPAVTAPAEAQEENAGFTLIAEFRYEDGTAVSKGSARIVMGENGMDYRLSGKGTLRASGLPREGALGLTLFDGDGRELASMGLIVIGGAVIDASTSSDGVGHLTLKEDTEETALIFTLDRDGALRCTLRLTRSTGL